MENRNITLSERTESTREKRVISVSVKFELNEIKDHFDSSLNAIKLQHNVADELLRLGKVEECKDIWRSQIVFLESILDFYIHELTKYALCKMFDTEWSKTEKYNNLMVPLSVVELALKTPESTSWFTNFIIEKCSREVYLSLESMRNQINLIGLNFEDIMASSFPKPKIPTPMYRDGKMIVKDLFERRNKIAHQSDRDHATAIRNDISKVFVNQCISDVEIIVSTLHTSAISKT